MRRPTRRNLAIILIVFASARSWAASSAKDRRFVSARHGLSVEAPPGWSLSTHTGFPSVVVLLLHPDQSRISIAASETQAKTARELVELNRPGIDAQGLKILNTRPGARDGIEVEARAAARNEAVVQLYLLRPLAPTGPGQAIIITLITPVDSLATHRGALDYVILKLGLNPIVNAAASTSPAAPKLTPRTTSAAERAAEK